MTSIVVLGSEVQLAPGIVAYMAHVLGDPEDATLDSLFVVTPEQVDDISLSLLFPTDFPVCIGRSLQLLVAAGFRSVAALPLCHAAPS